MTIDKGARTKLARLLRRMAVGHISNDEFEEERPDRSDDLAIRQVYKLGIWPLYPDHEVIKKPLGREERRLVARMILFLRSDIEYRWPPFQEASLGDLAGDIARSALWLVTIGLVRRPNAIKLPAGFKDAGDFAVWPFLSRSDYERVLRSPQFLSGRLSV